MTDSDNAKRKVQLHPANTHSAKHSDADDEETENDNLQNRDSTKPTRSKSKESDSKWRSKSKLASKMKNKLGAPKSDPKYSTLSTPNKHGARVATHKTNSTSSETHSSYVSAHADVLEDDEVMHAATPNPPHTSSQYQPGYKQWKGQNSIYFQGRCIGGPEVGKQVKTFILIFVPITLYFATTGVIMWQEYGYKWSTSLSVVLYIAVIVLFLLTSCIDPGIMPRAEAYESSAASTDVINYISRHEHSNNEIRKINLSPPWEQTINVGGNIRTIKYCYTCKHFRPPRIAMCAMDVWNASIIIVRG